MKADQTFHVGLDENGVLTLFVLAEALPDDALAELGRALESVQALRAIA